MLLVGTKKEYSARGTWCVLSGSIHGPRHDHGSGLEVFKTSRDATNWVRSGQGVLKPHGSGRVKRIEISRVGPIGLGRVRSGQEV